MKKYIFLLLVYCLSVLPLAAQQPHMEDAFYFQKQIIVTNERSCQAVYITKDWLLTAAHCVADFVKRSDCNVRLILAEGEEASASAVIGCNNVFLPEPLEGSTSLPFDLALLHYVDGSVPYEYFTADNTPIQNFDKFKNYLKTDSRLEDQWGKRVPSKFLPLYVFNKEGVEGGPQVLLNSILVPRWDQGQSSESFSNQHSLLLWKSTIKVADRSVRVYPTVMLTDNFEVSEGNSGGAVTALAKNDTAMLGLLGIVSAAPDTLSLEEFLAPARTLVPDFGTGKEILVFYGFTEKGSLAFIRNVLGDNSYNRIKKKELTKVIFHDDPMRDTHQLRAK